MSDRRIATLRAALAFLQLPPRAPELRLLHRWLDSWAGVGLIAVGLHRQGWDLQLTQYGDGKWRAAKAEARIGQDPGGAGAPP